MHRPEWIALDLNGTLLDAAAMLDDEHVELARAAARDPSPLNLRPSRSLRDEENAAGQRRH